MKLSGINDKKLNLKTEVRPMSRETEKTVSGPEQVLARLGSPITILVNQNYSTDPYQEGVYYWCGDLFVA